MKSHLNICQHCHMMPKDTPQRRDPSIQLCMLPFCRISDSAGGKRSQYLVAEFSRCRQSRRHRPRSSDWIAMPLPFPTMMDGGTICTSYSSLDVGWLVGARRAGFSDWEPSYSRVKYNKSHNVDANHYWRRVRGLCAFGVVGKKERSFLGGRLFYRYSNARWAADGFYNLSFDFGGFRRRDMCLCRGGRLF